MATSIEMSAKIDKMISGAPIQIKWEIVEAEIEKQSHNISHLFSPSEIAEEGNHLDNAFMMSLDNREFLSVHASP